MKNIAIPGVFPGVLAVLLTLAAIRGHVSYKKWNNKQYRTSKIICIIGAVIFYLIAIFQILEAFGISFR